MHKGRTFPLASVSDTQVIYENFYQERIEVVFAEEAVAGYIWENQRGDQTAYDHLGRVLWQGAVNRPKVYFTYNEVGYLRTLTDSQNQTLLTITYEDIPLDERTKFDRGVYRIKSISDYTSRTVTYNYQDGTGRLGSVIAVNGEQWQMRYNDKHFTGFIDPEGRKTTIDIDVEGRLRSYNNADGVGYSYDYDYDRSKEIFIVRNQSSAGRVQEMKFDFTGTQVERQVNGHVINFQDSAFSNLGTPIEKTKDLQTKYHWVWISAKCGGGGGGSGVAPEPKQDLIRDKAETYTYAAMANQLAIYGPDILGGEAVINEEAALLSGWSSGASDQSSNGCGSTGQQAPREYIRTRQFKDELGRTKIHTYDEIGNLKSINYADGTTEKFEYKKIPGFGKRIVRKQAKNATTVTYTYNAAAQLLFSIEAEGTDLERKTSYTYTNNGLLQSKIAHASPTSDGQGIDDASWAYEYDNFGNLSKASDPLGHSTTFSHYDALGNAGTTTNAIGQTLTQSFDVMGNLLTRLNQYSQGTSNTYDKAGFIKSSGSTAADTFQLMTNATGLPVDITDSLNNKSRIHYDLENRPQLLQDAQGHTQEFRYDDRGRISSYIDGEKNSTSYAFNAYLLTKVTYPTYREIYTYDKGDRLTEIKQGSDHNGSNLSYLNTRSYNVPERTQSQTDSNGNRSQTQFDELGRIKTYLDASGGVTEFTYDSRDNLLEVQDPEGRSTTYSYNKNNQIISIAITGKGVISYSPYDWLQYTTLTLSGGGGISYSVDGLMRQTGRSLTKPSGEVLASYAIAYDGESNILSIDESAASLSEPKQGTYGYDKLNRLTNIQNTVENSQYGYDGVGNRTTANGGFNGKNDDLTADYNDNNQLTRYGLDTYEYDANGHTVLRLDVIGYYSANWFL